MLELHLLNVGVMSWPFLLPLLIEYLNQEIHLKLKNSNTGQYLQPAVVGKLERWSFEFVVRW